MGCSGCSVKSAIGLPAGCKNNGSCATSGCGDKLDVYDWLANVQYIGEVEEYPVVEVKFKGTRKEYFRNAHFELETGDPVVVESATSGWDIGYVSLRGELVKLQMRKHHVDPNSELMRKVLRVAGSTDLEKFEDVKNREQETMIRARQIASSLGLSMKISDVEYQADNTKATFFYTAEGRVDFRELIKLLAREFRIKVEMRQIGLRQEAGRLGGIGSCGRELCCSTWLTDFHSVPTTAARYQNLFLNPLKLSGQCGRLKCCLNYELDTYVEALSEFPDENLTIRTEKGTARVEKLDLLKYIVWFRYENSQDDKLYPLTVDTVNMLAELNENGIVPSDLDQHQSEKEIPVVEELEFKDVVGEERLDRFDQKRNRNNRNKKKGPGNNNNQRQQDNRPSQPQVNAGNNPNQNRRNENQNRNGGNNPNQQRNNNNQRNNNAPRDNNQNQPRNQQPNDQQRPQNKNRNNRNRPNRSGGNNPGDNQPKGE
jgi:cell fate regulator YaaT (PSP1 superfamily)